MATQNQSQVYLRSALNSSANPSLASSLAAFSPDIIPLDQVKATPEQLTATYNRFVAHSIDLDEPETSIYIRGKQYGSEASANRTIASLHAVPNELILWPQVWGAANIIGHTVFELDPTEQVAVGAPIRYSPIPTSGQGHSHATLIATCATPNAAFSVPSVKNWRDLVENVGKNTSLAFYNVATADPRPRQTGITTKFRLIENEAPYVELFFGLETVGIPTSGIEASLNVVSNNPDKTGFSFGIDRQPLSQTGNCGKYVKVPSGFEGNVTLEVFNDKDQVFRDYSSISIVVYAVDSAGDVLIGAEHLVFDSNPRVKRVAQKCNPSLFSTQQTPPFYFRDSSTTGVFPRTGVASSSLDIQALGTVQDPSPATTLGGANFTVDVNAARGIGLKSGTSNYVYLRGTCTTATSGQTRLFYVTGAVLQYPIVYSQHSVFDYNEDGSPMGSFATRPYNTNSGAQLVFTDPFDILNPAYPPDGGHYCLIAESLTAGQTQWPHQLVTTFGTGAEYTTWVLSTPGVCWKNEGYTVNPSPDTYSVPTSLTIPVIFNPAVDDLQLQISAIGFPNGSTFFVTSNDPLIVFPTTTIVRNGQIDAIDLSGAWKPQFNYQIVIHWQANGQKPNTGQTFRLALAHFLGTTLSNVAQIATASSGHVQTAHPRKIIGKNYPNLIDPKATGGRTKIGGAIRARSLGESNDDAHSSNIPIDTYYWIGADAYKTILN